MPPKKKQDGASKKTVEKKKEKVIEDKTFGLKNKKGNKQQKYISQVVSQVKHGNVKATQAEKEREKLNAEKDKKKKLQDEINSLFVPVAQKVTKGADPKSVLCAFFKQGQCGKGAKCKFSHDLTIERKTEKRNMYEEEKEDNMDDWDEAKLEEVVNKKHGESDKAKPTTAIICKHFLDAVENSKYGWFWECPEEKKTQKPCKYRHALPPGFVLKKDMKKDDKEDKISMEELVEAERAALGFNTTKVTLETFLKWKERKRKEKIDALKDATDKKKTDFKAGKMAGISGRQMFEFNPELMTGDDDEDGGAVAFEREVEEPSDIKVVDVGLTSFKATDVDNSGTQAVNDRLKSVPNGQPSTSESAKLGEAAALPGTSKGGEARLQQEETDAAIAAAVNATINGDLDIDEDLFDGDDIDLVEEDLETLDLEDDPSS